MAMDLAQYMVLFYAAICECRLYKLIDKPIDNFDRAIHLLLSVQK